MVQSFKSFHLIVLLLCACATFVCKQLLHFTSEQVVFEPVEGVSGAFR